MPNVMSRSPVSKLKATIRPERAEVEPASSSARLANPRVEGGANSHVDCGGVVVSGGGPGQEHEAGHLYSPPRPQHHDRRSRLGPASRHRTVEVRIGDGPWSIAGPATQNTTDTWRQRSYPWRQPLAATPSAPVPPTRTARLRRKSGPAAFRRRQRLALRRHQRPVEPQPAGTAGKRRCRALAAFVRGWDAAGQGAGLGSNASSAGSSQTTGGHGATGP